MPGSEGRVAVFFRGVWRIDGYPWLLLLQVNAVSRDSEEYCDEDSMDGG